MNGSQHGAPGDPYAPNTQVETPKWKHPSGKAHLPDQQKEGGQCTLPTGNPMLPHIDAASQSHMSVSSPIQTLQD